MSIHIVIANLPPEVTPEGVQTRFARLGIATAVILNREGDPHKVTALIQSEGLDRPAADEIASKIDGAFYHGRRLHAYVPLFMQG